MLLGERRVAVLDGTGQGLREARRGAEGSELAHQHHAHEREVLDRVGDARGDALAVVGVRVEHETIARLAREIKAPVSILAGLECPGVRELQDLGVARVSYGSAFTRAAIGAVKRLAVEVRDSGSIAALKDAISSQEMKTLVSRGRAVS